MITLTIDGRQVRVPEGTSVLDACREAQIVIPTLCKHPDLQATANCGVCVVKINGRMLRACCTPVVEGMQIITHDSDIVKARKTIVELILSDHPNDCLSCLKNGNCELQNLAKELSLDNQTFENITPNEKESPLDNSTGCIQIDSRKCIQCGRCVQVCQNIQNIYALSSLHRGIKTRIAPAGGVSLADSPCIKCGQCSAHCPTGAIMELDETKKVLSYLQDPKKYCVVQIAPAVRVAIGEAFGYESGTLLTGKIYAALRRMGFQAVFDTNFGADLTIMEEGSEFVKRFTTAPETLPLITSCCPAWVDYLEKVGHDMISHFSTAKSPQAMLGALVKTYYADKVGVKPEDMIVISVMPCTAKKWEIKRSKEMFHGGHQDIDVSLTTRELVRLIKQMGIDFKALPEEQADSPLGTYTGAATIFGFSGGVMEAALRTAHYLMTGQELQNLEFDQITDLNEGAKEMTLNIQNREIRVAVAHGIKNVETILEKVRRAKANGEKSPYDFIEVMACVGGCVGGGGQPLGTTRTVRLARQAGLKAEDRKAPLRCSHQNPDIQKLYKDFLGAPLSEKSEELLHTHYTARPLYRK